MIPSAPARLDLRVGGLEKLSLVDWPGRLCAVVFFQGCTWRCRYCHNPHLISFTTQPALAWQDVLGFLRRRRGLLDGVVFSGGEPTWQPHLAEAMQAVRELGFRIGLHTGGPAPGRLRPLLPFLDWVGFDFKAPVPDYVKVTGKDDGSQAWESLRLLRSADIPCEIRTTWHPLLLTPADLETMATTLVAAGCSEWVIQRFRPDGCADGKLLRTSTNAPLVARLLQRGITLVVR